jgi:hypothetical protein
MIRASDALVYWRMGAIRTRPVGTTAFKHGEETGLPSLGWIGQRG